MSAFSNPYDPDRKLGYTCACGKHASRFEHEAEHAVPDGLNAHDPEMLSNRAIESAMVRALFPDDAMRRRFLRAVGANTAMAAIASVLPIGAM